MRALRLPIALVGLVVLAWVGWTIVQSTRADELAGTNPAAALRIDPDHPQALLRLARQQLEAKDYGAATETARHVLRVEPGQGDAFAILALAAVGRGDDNAAELIAIAVQRAPRTLDVVQGSGTDGHARRIPDARRGYERTGTLTCKRPRLVQFSSALV